MTTDTTALTAAVGRALVSGTKIPADVVRVLQEHPVMQLVEALQETLTSTDDKRVSIALHVLGQGCRGRSGTAVALDKAAVVTLTQFLGHKAKRYGTMDAAVEAARHVFVDIADGARCNISTSGDEESAARPPTGASVLADNDVIDALLTHLFTQVHAQSMLVSTRGLLFDIYAAYLLEDGTGAAPQPSLGRAFVQRGGGVLLKTYLAAVDGERDPVQLLRVFRMHASVLRNVDEAQLVFLVDDYFEACSAYFPVLFSPPPGCAVSRNDLRVALRDVLCAHPFVELCIPFVCTKLQSPSSSSKLDAIDVLQHLFSTAGSAPGVDLERLRALSSEVLTVLRAEVLKINAFVHRSPEALQLLSQCLDLARSVTACIAAGVTSRETLLSLLEPIVGGAVSTIETDTSAGRAYATLLHAAIRGSPETAIATVSYLFPVCGSLMFQPSSPAQRLRRLENVCSCVGGLVSGLEELLWKGALTEFPLDNVRPGVLKGLLDAIADVFEAECDGYLVRVCGETLVAWCSVARKAGEAWLPGDGHASSGESSPFLAVYRNVLRKAFSATVDSDAQSALMTALGNVSRVDKDVHRLFFNRESTSSSDTDAGVPQSGLVGPGMVAGFVCDPSFLAHLRTAAVASGREGGLALPVISLLLSDATLVEGKKQVDDVCGSACDSTFEAEVFSLVSTLLPLCHPADVQREASEWTRLLLRAETIASFDIATILFSAVDAKEQLALLREGLAHPGGTSPNDRVGQHVHVDPESSGSTTASGFVSSPNDISYLAKMALSGMDAALLRATVSPSEACNLIATLVSHVASCSEGGAVASFHCITSLANKVSLDSDANAALVEALQRMQSDSAANASQSAATSQQRVPLVCAAMAKGLMAKGLWVLALPWCEELLRLLSVDDTLAHTMRETAPAPKERTEERSSFHGTAAYASGALSHIVRPPQPAVSTGLWEQRFLSFVVPRLANCDSTTCLTALASLVSFAKPTLIWPLRTPILQRLRRLAPCHVAKGSQQTGESALDSWCGAVALIHALQKVEEATNTSDARRRTSEPSSEMPVVASLLLADGAHLLHGILTIVGASTKSAANGVNMTNRRTAMAVLTNLANEMEQATSAQQAPVGVRSPVGGAAVTSAASAGPAESSAAVAVRRVEQGITCMPADEAISVASSLSKHITRALDVALAHPKRLVRSDAAACRHTWSLVWKR